MLSFSKCGIFKLGTGCECRLFSQILKLPGPLRVTTLMFYYFFVSNFSVVFQLKEVFSMLRFLTLADMGSLSLVHGLQVTSV